MEGERQRPRLSSTLSPAVCLPLRRLVGDAQGTRAIAGVPADDPVSRGQSLTAQEDMRARMYTLSGSDQPPGGKGSPVSADKQESQKGKVRQGQSTWRGPLCTPGRG